MQKSETVTETFINIQRSTSPFEDLYSTKNNSNEDALGAPRHNPRRDRSALFVSWWINFLIIFLLTESKLQIINETFWLI